ncbi:MAG: NAD-dependent epimerase/dehydratase family protein [Bacteroidota bacterium]
MTKERILVTGGGGQIGTALSAALREQHGEDNVIVSDIKQPSSSQRLRPAEVQSSRPQHEKRGRFVMLDILNTQRMAEIIDDYKITQIYHLAAILSATGEWMPEKTWNVNLNAVLELFNLCREKGIKKFFFPSTIAVFGHTTPKDNTPQHTSLEPSTVYGMSKLAGELWAQYYWNRYQFDIRSIRFPGIISHETLPGGGTTDYAVDIFYEAIKNGRYTCFLKEDTYLPMIYMPDAIRSCLDIMNAPAEDIKVRTSYNLGSLSFSPAELTREIQTLQPDFSIDYEPDYRQAIADSWPSSIDDSAARADWGWQPEYNLQAMTRDMMVNLERKLGKPNGVAL